MLLLDFNTRVVVIGTTLLGLTSGIVGVFTLLRKRALLGDAISHAMLPGIGAAFLLGTWWGWDAKSLPWLLTGALVSGLVGVATILAIRRWTRLREDVALGLVLSVYFGLGVSVLGVVQQMETGHAAGLEGFIYGKTATMIVRDVGWIIGACLICLLIASLFFKEMRLVCFDQEFAGSCGISVVLVDVLMMAMVVTVTIVGLQAVGLILMIALLVIPAAAARFWTDSMDWMSVLSAMIGALSGAMGALASAALPRLPSGAMIVLAASTVFGVSLLVGTQRGLVQRTWQRVSTRRRIATQHLLRAMFEQLEARGISVETRINEDVAVRFSDLVPKRSWSVRGLRRIIRRAERAEWVQDRGDGHVRLTMAGFREAARLAHEHRLLELYLMTHADVAPSRVDRGADTIEHYLDADLIEQLEAQLHLQRPAAVVESPHPLP